MVNANPISPSNPNDFNSSLSAKVNTSAELGTGTSTGLGANTGAAASPIPPTSSSTTPIKLKKKFNWKIILGALALILLLTGVAAAYFLSQQSQDIRQQAASNCCETGWSCDDNDPNKPNWEQGWYACRNGECDGCRDTAAVEQVQNAIVENQTNPPAESTPTESAPAAPADDCIVWSPCGGCINGAQRCTQSTSGGVKTCNTWIQEECTQCQIGGFCPEGQSCAQGQKCPNGYCAYSCLTGTQCGQYVEGSTCGSTGYGHWVCDSSTSGHCDGDTINQGTPDVVPDQTGTGGTDTTTTNTTTQACPPGTTLNGVVCECDTKAGKGVNPGDSLTKVAEVCGAGTDSGTGTDNCPAGTSDYYGGMTYIAGCQCTNNPSIIIPVNSANSSNCGTTVQSCPPNTTKEGDICMCDSINKGVPFGSTKAEADYVCSGSAQSCPPGTTLNGVVCECDTKAGKAVEPGATLSQVDEVCYTGDQSCPTGTTLNGSICMCNGINKGVALGSSKAEADYVCSTSSSAVSCVTNADCSTGEQCISGKCTITTGTSNLSADTSASTAGMCPNPPYEAAVQYVKFTCPDGCTMKNGYWQCFENAVFSSSPLSLAAGECGQVDVYTRENDWDSYCGFSELNCNDSCKPSGGETPVSYGCNANCQSDTQCQDTSKGGDARFICSDSKCRLADNPSSDQCRPAVGPQCLNLTLNNVTNPSAATVSLNDQVNFTCGTVTGIDHYVFRIFAPNQSGATVLSSAASGSSTSQNYTVNQSGKYFAQCQVCLSADPSSCLPWEPAE